MEEVLIYENLLLHVKNNDIKNVEKLLIDMSDKYTDNLYLNISLYVAISCGYFDILKLLLKLDNIDVNINNIYNTNDSNINNDIYNTLVKKTVSMLSKYRLIDMLSHINSTPLMLACNNKHLKIVKLLLNNNADPNIQDEGGINCLQAASYYNYIDIAKILLEHKANPNIQDMYHNTPIMFSKSNEMKNLFYDYGSLINKLEYKQLTDYIILNERKKYTNLIYNNTSLNKDVSSEISSYLI